MNDECREYCGRFGCRWNSGFGVCTDFAPCEWQLDEPDEPDPDERRDWRDLEDE